MAKTDVITWIDVETTGIKAADNRLLEVACVMTDTDLNILDEEGYHADIFNDPDFVYDLANDYVKAMHSTSGLWGRLAYGKPLDQVDIELQAYIAQFAPEARQARLAGNSVRLDANYIDEYLPLTSEHLHYRIIDVSSIAYEATLRGIDIYRKAGTHEAMIDIRESIEELRYLRTELYK